MYLMTEGGDKDKIFERIRCRREDKDNRHKSIVYKKFLSVEEGASKCMKMIMGREKLRGADGVQRGEMIIRERKWETCLLIMRGMNGRRKMKMMMNRMIILTSSLLT